MELQFNPYAFIFELELYDWTTLRLYHCTTVQNTAYEVWNINGIQVDRGISG
jgi:hypothetical protein